MSTAETGQTEMKQFFETVLADQGLYCLAKLNSTDDFDHYVVDGIDDLVGKADELSAGKENIFFALGTLKERNVWNEQKKKHEVRTAVNISHMRSFFLDLDVGQGANKYPTQEDANKALVQFCSDVGLPRPMILSSGGGLHVYWPLSESVAAAGWKVEAEKFKKLAKHHKLKADPKVTADMARVLRPVGTINYKTDPGKPVKKYCDAKRVMTFAEFAEIVDKATPVTDSTVLATIPNNTAQTYPDKNIDLIYQQCQQLADCLETGGPVGYARREDWVSIIKHCADPDYSVLLLNDKDPNTVQQQTEQMLSTSTSDNPHTCEKFEENNPGGCDGCQHHGQIKSPISLGIKRQGTDETGGNNALPKNYKLTGSALLYETPAKKGEHPTQHRLSNYLVVKAVTRDSDGDNYGRYIEYKDTDGRLRHMSVPAEAVHDPKELIKRLTNYGADISPNPFAKERLQQYLIDSKPSKRKTCVTRLGWVTGDIWLPGSGFALTDKTITAPGGEDIVYQGTGNAPVSERGTLEQWKSEVGALCVNNTRLIISLCTSWAGTLLRPLGYDDNFGLHICGDSSSGKTRTLVVACSVWGNPEKLKGSWNTTLVGLEAMAADRNDMIVTLDEIKEAKLDLGAAVMMLANGSGRARGDRNGDAKAIRTFKNTHISTGEFTIDEHIQRSGGTMQAGFTVRTLNIPIPGPHGAFEDIHGYSCGRDFATALSRATKLYHGTVGRVWLERLVTTLSNPANKKLLTDRIDEFVNGLADADKHGQIQRVAQNFGLLYAAGQLAIEWGLVDWSRKQVTDAVKACFNAWLETRGGGEKSHEELSIVSQFRSFIFRNASRFQDGATICDDSVKIPNRLGYAFKGFYYIRHTELGTICHELQLNGGADKAEKVLRDAKIIVSKERKINKSGRLEVPAVDVGGFIDNKGKRTNFKQVRAHILQFDEDVSADTPAQGVAE